MAASAIQKHISCCWRCSLKSLLPSVVQVIFWSSPIHTSNRTRTRPLFSFYLERLKRTKYDSYGINSKTLGEGGGKLTDGKTSALLFGISHWEFQNSFSDWRIPKIPVFCRFVNQRSKIDQTFVRYSSNLLRVTGQHATLCSFLSVFPQNI